MRSDGMKPVDQLLRSGPRVRSLKRAWIFPELLCSGSSVKPTQSDDCAMHAEDTDTNAKSRAPMNARGRLMVLSPCQFLGQSSPVRPWGRFEVPVGQMSVVVLCGRQPPGSGFGFQPRGGGGVRGGVGGLTVPRALSSTRPSASFTLIPDAFTRAAKPGSTPTARNWTKSPRSP